MTRTLEYDVLIVGSGAGGGTVAARLAKLCAAGARIAVVERGAWYPKESFNMRERDMLRLFRDHGATPSQNMEIAVSAAHCVGGGTAVYTGVTFRTPPGLLDQWARDQGLEGFDEADIQARFPRLEAEIDAHFPDLEMENANNRLFREGCEKLGWPVHRFRVNIKDCVGCGFCNLGCPYGAKRGTLEVQIPQAAARGVEIIPNCHITRLTDEGAEGLIGPAPDASLPGPYAPGPVRFRAKRVVLAAGALASPALLLASGLEGLSPACGRYMTLHPALTSFGRMPEEVRGFDGFPKLYYSDQFSESHHYYIESAFYYPFTTARSLPGFGERLKQFMRSYPHLTCALTLVHDAPEPHNRITLNRRGEPRLDYTLSTSTREALIHAQRSVGRLFFAAGAEEYVSPVGRGFSVERDGDLEAYVDASGLVSGKVVVSSAHPQGGCRMGSDFETSVTDAWGRVHNYPNVQVADASLFPTSTKVNPYLTIMALADRIAEQIEATLH